MPLNACELEVDLFCHGMRVAGDLAERTAGFYSYEGFRRITRLAAAPLFHRRMRTA